MKSFLRKTPQVEVATCRRIKQRTLNIMHDFFQIFFFHSSEQRAIKFHEHQLKAQFSFDAFW